MAKKPTKGKPAARKKPPAKKKAPAGLTPEQAKELGGKLLGTRNNIYREAERLYGVKGGDELFDAVRDHAGVFRCENCNEWQDIKEEMDPDVAGMCRGCVDEINANEMDCEGEEEQE